MRKRELERRLQEAEQRERDLHAKLLHAEAAQGRIHRECMERIERMERKHNERVDQLLVTLTNPEAFALYARGRELEAIADEDAPARTFRGEDDEETLGMRERRLKAQQISDELARRGVTPEDIADAALGA